MSFGVRSILRQRWLLFSGALLTLLVAVAVMARLPTAEPVTASNPDNSITSPDTAGDVGFHTSIALDAAGNPVVSYYDSSSRNLKLLHCGNASCTSGNSIASPDTGGSVGQHTSLALDAAGNAVVSYYDLSNANLKVLHCGNADCTSGNSITTPDTAGQVGEYTSITLDVLGYPVISYRDSSPNLDLKVLHCGDANCSSGNVITSPDTSGNAGIDTSIALDGNGFPVVSYYESGQGLKVLHCGDANCATGNTITFADASGGRNSSLALDGAGNPVVSYEGPGLKVLHCGDPNCTAGNTTSQPDTGSVSTTSLVLDASDFAVVSYREGVNDDLRVLHCGNAACDAGNSITIPDEKGDVGANSSITLDASGNPVVSYRDSTNDDLKVLHCDDPNCFESKPAPTWTPTDTPTPTPTPLAPAAMPLTVPGHDVCDDPDQPSVCYFPTGTTFTVSADLLFPPAVGYTHLQAWLDYDNQGLIDKQNTQATWPDCNQQSYLSIADVANNGAQGGCLTGFIPPQPPSFHEGSVFTFELTYTGSPTTSTLNLLYSGDPIAGTSGTIGHDINGGHIFPVLSPLTIECIDPGPGDTDGDGCSDQQEFGPDETLGGRRNFLNPWDFFDVEGPGGGPPDGEIDLPNDILGIILHFAPLGLPPYDIAYDRGHRDGNTLWSMTAPDGVIDLPIDILGVIYQFGHTCQ